MLFKFSEVEFFVEGHSDSVSIWDLGVTSEMPPASFES